MVNIYYNTNINMDMNIDLCIICNKFYGCPATDYCCSVCYNFPANKIKPVLCDDNIIYIFRKFNQYFKKN